MKWGTEQNKILALPLLYFCCVRVFCFVSCSEVLENLRELHAQFILENCKYTANIRMLPRFFSMKADFVSTDNCDFGGIICFLVWMELNPRRCQFWRRSWWLSSVNYDCWENARNSKILRASTLWRKHCIVENSLWCLLKIHLHSCMQSLEYVTSVFENVTLITKAINVLWPKLHTVLCYLSICVILCIFRLLMYFILLSYKNWRDVPDCLISRQCIVSGCKNGPRHWSLTYSNIILTQVITLKSCVTQATCFAKWRKKKCLAMQRETRVQFSYRKYHSASDVTNWVEGVKWQRIISQKSEKAPDIFCVIEQ